MAMAQMKLPLFKPPILTGKYLSRVLKSRWLTTGPVTEKFRLAVARHFDVDPGRIALAGRATAIWQAILDYYALDFKEKKNVVYIAEHTFTGMKQAIGHAGLSRTNIDDADIVVLTDIGGRSWIEPVPPARPYLLIHDACHSWQLANVNAHFTIFSCYPTKFVPGAEGGVAICSDSTIAHEIELRVSSGLPAPGCIEPICVGREYHMTDVQAALNIEALERSEKYQAELNQSWERLARCCARKKIEYRFMSAPHYLFQLPLKNTDSVVHLQIFLRSEGIESGWHFPPLPLITLPLFPEMSETSCCRIIDTIRRWRRK